MKKNRFDSIKVYLRYLVLLKYKCIKIINKLQKYPERIYIFLALIIGILLVFLTPPFEIPDESSHFYRAYQISELHIIGTKKDDTTGGYLPKSLQSVATGVTKNIPFHPEEKTSYNEIVSYLDTPLKKEDKCYYSFANTVLYSPIPYLPQSIAIGIGKLFNLSPLILFYLARIFNLLTSITFIYLAIKYSPILKWLFFLLGLMPMTIFLFSSLSPDSVLISSSFLAISYMLKVANNKTEKISKMQISLIILLLTIIALSKQSYIFMTLLVFVIPNKKFANTSNYIKFIIISLIIPIGMMMIWSILTQSIYSPARTDIFIDPKEQSFYVIKHPHLFFTILIKEVFNSKEYLRMFIGQLGWLDTKLPKFQIIIYTLLLIATAIIDRINSVKIYLSDRLKFLSIFILSTVFIFFSLYITWNTPGSGKIEGVQGRYFIPIIPLLFISLPYKKVQNKLSTVFYLFITIFTIFSVIITVNIVKERFYY